MIVEELLATLGVEVDVAEFLEAEGALHKLKFALGAVAVGLGLNELKELVHGVVEVGDEASRASKKLGVSAEAIQELGYAAKVTHVSQQALEGAMFRLSRGMEKMATTGKGPAADALRKLHISAKDLKGEDLDANLETIADAFAKMPDGQQKAALAMQLFGGAGRQLIPLLDRGAAGIQELREEAQRLGVVISDETAEKMEELEEDQTRVSEAWRGMKVQIVSDLIPALHDMTTGLLEWLKTNGDWIRLGLGAVVEVVADAFKVLGFVVGETTTFVRNLYDFFVKYPTVTAILAGVILSYFTPALIGLATAAWAAAAAFVVLYLPIIALIAVITSIVLLVNYWGDIWPVVSAKAGAAWDFIKTKALSFFTWIKDGLGHVVTSVVDAFASLGQKISDAVGRAFDYLVEKAIQTGKDIWHAIESIPVIGHAIRAGEFIIDQGRTAFSGGGGQNSQVPGFGDSIDRLRSYGEGVPYTPSGSGPTFGDTSVTIQTTGKLDEQKVGEIAAQEVVKAQRTMVRDAHDNLSGGVR